MRRTVPLLFWTVILVSLIGPSKSDINIRCVSVNVHLPVRADEEGEPLSMWGSFPKNYHECTVLEGNFVIAYDDGKDGKGKRVYPAFPKLREIRGMLMVYNSDNITSLSDILPALRVIRGENLVLGYSLAIFNNQNLRFLGLSNLSAILRGGVRIEDNPLMCFASDIHWTLIVKETDALVKVVNGIYEEGCQYLSCENNSALRNSSSCLKNEQNELVCWDSEHCQTAPSTNCDSECVGGCFQKQDALSCAACVHVHSEEKCMQKCRSGEVLLMPEAWQCVSVEQCVEYGGKTLKSNEGNNDQCWRTCPTGYGAFNDQQTCVPCDEPQCWTTCKSDVVIETVANLAYHAKRRYQSIQGNVIISISSTTPSTKQLLSEVLGEIIEIHGYLRVVATDLLISFDVFRNLRRIHGKQLYWDRYSLVMLENPYLKSVVFPNNVVIDQGLANIQNNPMLCVGNITELLEQSGMADKQHVGDSSIGRRSNGERALCNARPLSLEIKDIRPNTNSVTAEWKFSELMKNDDFIEHMIGYKLYLRELDGEESNAGTYADDRELWTSIFVEMPPPGRSDIKYGEVIANDTHRKNVTLPSFHTWYVMYVETVTLHALDIDDTQPTGARSTMVKFLSANAPPHSPRNIDVSAVSVSSVTIEWSVPEHTNGFISHYMLQYKKVDDTCLLERVDYCQGHHRSIPQNKIKQTNKCVSEYKQRTETETMEQQIAYQKEMFKFEHALQNAIIIDSAPPAPATSTRFKRSVPEIDDKSLNETPEPTTTCERNLHDCSDTVTVNGREFKHHAGKFNTSALTATLANLQHYTIYEITIRACQRPSNNLGFCSPEHHFSIRTLPNVTQDAINQSSILIGHNSADVQLTEHKRHNPNTEHLIVWDKPLYPNGQVLYYSVLVRRGTGDSLNETHCVSTQLHAKLNGYLLTRLPVGEYQIQIRAHTLHGPGPLSEPIDLVIESSKMWLWGVGIGIVIVLIIVSATMTVSYWMYRRRRQKDWQTMIGICDLYIPQIDIYERDEWDIERDRVEVLHELGSGTFGKVYAGRGHGVLSQSGLSFGECAIKSVANNADFYSRYAFLQEASIMKNFRTAFIVQLYGVVSNGQPALIIMEYMRNGNLQDYLRRHRPGAPENEDNRPAPFLSQTYLWAGQIADGMAYLESRRFCHRDVAARNCLLTNDLVCKIGDFGMARDVYIKDYYRPKERRLCPVRWMAPEALMYSTFTLKSDVWAYGVVLWEICTLGLTPYPGLPVEDIHEFVGKRKGTLINTRRYRPIGCPEKMLQLMESCWAYDAKDRLMFCDLVRMLIPQMDDHFKEVSHTTTTADPSSPTLNVGSCTDESTSTSLAMTTIDKSLTDRATSIPDIKETTTSTHVLPGKRRRAVPSLRSVDSGIMNESMTSSGGSSGESRTLLANDRDRVVAT